jgi:methylated-DNA-protein-cysteine methyltransferase related protein
VRSFPEQVYAIVLEVPRGRVITYGAIARLLGDPRKARQVGWAMAATPERRPRIPAHRVIKASGELPGGHAAHRGRLEAEGVRFLANGRVDLETHFWMPNEAISNQPSAIRESQRLTADC